MACSILNKMNEDGVSETISTVLLVGLTVIGVALISVMLFSQPLAEGLPAVDIIVSNSSSKILFQHNGGDALGKNEFTIFVGGVAVDPIDLHIGDTGDGEWPWSVGETLQYSPLGAIPLLSENVRIVYGESDSGSIIRPSFVDKAGNSNERVDIVPGPLPTSSPTGVTPPPSPAEAGEFVANSVLADSDIMVSFGSLKNGAILDNKYLKFTINSSDSKIYINGQTTPELLNNGDQITITTKGTNMNQDGISIVGVGNTFFTLRFVDAVVRKNGVILANNGIESAWIPEYKDLESTLSFELASPSKLYVNGMLTTGGNGTLNDVRPTDSGMFVINVMSGTNKENSIILAKTGPI